MSPRCPSILLIDNFDSFTWNVADYLRQLGAAVCVKQRPMVKLAELADFDGIVFSPGPGNPTEMPDLLSLIAHTVEMKPCFGICLGFQAIAFHFGSSIVRSNPMHGKVSLVKTLPGKWLLAQVPPQFSVVRYHSLCVDRFLPPLAAVAVAHSGEWMAFEHQWLPIAGVQYHPEAHLTEFGHAVLANWLGLC